MRGRDLKRLSGMAMLLLAVAACSKKEEPAAAPATTASTAVSCHPQLQRLMDVLPGKAEIEGQKITGRDCRSGMAAVTYGNGEPLLLSFELTALRYAESDLEAMGPRSGQELLDNLRKTLETRIVVNESVVKAAAKAVTPAADRLQPEERRQLPREITLPNGAKAMISTEDGHDWELDAVLSERHMLVMHWQDDRKPVTTDEAAAAFGRMATYLQFDKLK